MSQYTFRILKLYRHQGITKRDLVEKSTKGRNLEQCLNNYFMFSEHNKDRKIRYLLEIDDVSQPADLTTEQKGFYVIKQKKIRITRHKKQLGSQNLPDLFYRHRCPTMKGCKPKAARYRYFSAKGLLLHLKQVHPDFKPPELRPIDVRIEAYDRATKTIEAKI